MTVKKGTLVAACVVELQWTGPSCGRALQSVLVVAGEMGKSVFPTWCETATTVSFCALAASAADKTRSIIIAFMTLLLSSGAVTPHPMLRLPGKRPERQYNATPLHKCNHLPSHDSEVRF